MSPTALYPCPYCAVDEAGGGIHGPMSNPTPRDPVEVLLKDHEFLAGCLDRIEGACGMILGDGFSLDAFDVIVDAVNHISRELRGHHHREEDVLMPYLRRHIGDRALELPESHLELWNALDHVVGNLRAIEEGRITGLSVDGLVQSVVLVAGAIREHLIMENTELFPLAKQLLTREEYSELTNIMNHELEH